jgi:hypothetical protein
LTIDSVRFTTNTYANKLATGDSGQTYGDSSFLAPPKRPPPRGIPNKPACRETPVTPSVAKEAVDDAAIEMQLKNRMIRADQREGIIVKETLLSSTCVVQMDFVIPTGTWKAENET